jgi:hypothetical protein
MKLKGFCIPKEEWRESTEGEKIFASYSLNKGLKSRIYKQLKKLNTTRTNNPINKRPNDLNRQFSKEDVHMANKYLQKCSAFLAIKEMQTKISLRF